MSVRLPDDPARHFREVWVGAPGVGVWPVAARFAMWGLAIALWFPSWVVLAFIVPLITFPVLLVLAAMRYVKRHDPSLLLWARIGLIGGLVLLVSFKPSLTFWVESMHWALAVPLAPALAVFLTSRIAPYIDLNVPLRYRIGLLFGVARRPRRTRAVQSINVDEQVLVVGEDVDLDAYRPKLSLIKR